MSTIVIFDPGTALFSSVSGVEAAAPCNQGKLLLNILIELRVQTQHLAQISGIVDDPQSMRADVVAHGSTV